MPSSPKLSVIIVSFNTKELTAHAVDSVLTTYDKVEVIVIDNNSHDGSVIALKKEFGNKIVVTVNTENTGFARANNQGVKLAHGTYVMLLNSDAIVHSGALQALVDVLRFNWNIGAVAARLKNSDGSYQPQGGALPTFFNVAAWWLWPVPGVIPGLRPYQDPNDAKKGKLLMDRGWVGGTAVMFRRDEYLTVGGLDEKIFMYAEDVDLCFRLQAAKLKVAIASTALVTHLGMQSGSLSKSRIGEIKGLLYFFGKHKPTWQVLGLKIVFLVGSLLRYVLFGILKGSSEARRLYSQAIAIAVR